MILTDREIRVACQSGHITISPEPNFSEALSSTSLDLTLADHIRIWPRVDVAGYESVVSPAAAGYSYNNLASKITQASSLGEAGHVIKPGDFLLAWTREEVSLPMTSKLAARVEGKSSLARLGIGVHVTAPTIHAGFDGPIQLEMFNHGPLQVKLEVGMRVCQLIFEMISGTPDKGYGGQFLHQKP